jgi:hypothetical protein
MRKGAGSDTPFFTSHNTPWFLETQSNQILWIRTTTEFQEKNF